MNKFIGIDVYYPNPDDFTKEVEKVKICINRDDFEQMTDEGLAHHIKKALSILEDKLEKK